MSFKNLLDNNRRWADSHVAQSAEYFSGIAKVHKPHTLFVGCSDARVPGELMLGAEPGELFVHRNIANQVHPTDPSLNAILQYAIDVLGVEHVVVCGHEGCGGVNAALTDKAPLLVDAWVSDVRNTMRLNREALDAIADMGERLTRLVELNVAEQVAHVARSPIVQQAGERGQSLELHGWVYSLAQGHVRDLGVSRDGRPAG